MTEQTNRPGLWDDAEVISTYTRAEAIEDGVLVDVSQMAKESGFRVPVAISRALWIDIEDIPKSKRGFQDSSGRLWDVLWMAFFGIGRGMGEGREMFTFPLTMHVGRKSLYRVKVHSGPGDNGEHVITMMKPEED